MPGILISATVAMAAAFVSHHHGGPTLLYALLFGMAFHSLMQGSKAAAGIGFSSKTILRIGVALLGARIGIAQISDLGWTPIVIVLGGVTSTIVFGFAFARYLGLSRDQGILTGGAVAICGASAALAIAAIIPDHKNKERDTLFTVVAVTILSTIAMVFYPLLVRAFQLDASSGGLLLGATIHDVAQVVAAGHMISDDAGLVATYVKLLRVALLLPVVIVLVWFISNSTEPSKRPAIPLFLMAFALLVVVNSLGLIPASVMSFLGQCSRWCLIVAIAALGMKTSLSELAHIGWLPLVLVIAETLFLFVVVSIGMWIAGA